MKKKVLLTVIWITGLFFSFFYHLPNTKAYPVDYQVKAEVSSSIETLQIFYLLKYKTGYSQCEYENTIFKKLSLEWFAPYMNHKAVQDFKETISQAYTQEELIDLFSQISHNSSGIYDLTSPSLKKDQQLANWMKDVNDFLVESQSDVFFNRMKDYYSLLPGTLSPRNSFMITLQSICSLFQIQDCKLYITPTLMHQFYLMPRQMDNKLSVTIILGLQSIENGYISFTSSTLQQELLYTYLMNDCLEYSMRKFQPEVEKMNSLWPEVQEAMQKDNIGTWQEAFQENLRISLLYRLFPDAYTVGLFNQKTGSGYIYLPFTAGIVEEYFRNRPFYRVFDSLATKVLVRFSKYPN